MHAAAAKRERDLGALLDIAALSSSTKHDSIIIGTHL